MSVDQDESADDQSMLFRGTSPKFSLEVIEFQNKEAGVTDKSVDFKAQRHLRLNESDGQHSDEHSLIDLNRSQP